MNYYIDRILKEEKITTFLESRGIFPVKKSGNKIVYRCPIHSGDNDPSFMVYEAGTKKDYQTYHCFGCHSGTDIINLKKDLDDISMRDAIKFFLKGIKIDKKDVTDSIIDDIQKGKSAIEDNEKVEPLLLLINSICREHLITYKDDEQIEFFEEFFRRVDRVARAKNIKMLKEIHNILIDRGGLENMTDKFQKRQEENINNSASWQI